MTEFNFGVLLDGRSVSFFMVEGFVFVFLSLT